MLDISDINDVMTDNHKPPRPAKPTKPARPAGERWTRAEIEAARAQFPVRLSRPDYEAVQTLAASRGESVNSLVTNAIRTFAAQPDVVPDDAMSERAAQAIARLSGEE